MTRRAPKVAKCKHPKLDKSLCCKDCGVLVDIRENKNKYGARRTNGFHSAKEEKRFRELIRDPEVFNLQCQREWALEVNGIFICKYRSDFSYLRRKDQVVEDVKGCKKGAAYSLFTLKKHLMKACHSVDVIEV